MASTKLQFEARRKIPTLKPRRKKIWQAKQKSLTQDFLESCISSGGRSQTSTSHSKPSPGRETRQKLGTYNRGPSLLILIKSFKIFFLSQPVQAYVPRIPEISNTQRQPEQAEIELMLRKGTISQIDHTQGEFISMLLVVEKRAEVRIQ